MESITIYPENEKQKSLLKSLLEEMKIRFVEGKVPENSLYTEEEYISKINKSIEKAQKGRTKKLNKTYRILYDM